MQEQLSDFIAQHESRIAPFNDGLVTVHLRGSLTPGVEAGNGCADGLRKVLADRDAFSRIRTYSHAPTIQDPLLKRQADVLYRLYLGFQVEPRLEDDLARVTEELRTSILGFRCDLGAGPIGWDDVWTLFGYGDDVRVRREAWNKVMDLADHVATMRLELVALQNRGARPQGFDDHRELGMLLNELDGFDIDPVLDGACTATDRPFANLRTGVDRDLCELLNARRGFLGPWHYPNPLRVLVPWDAEFEGPPRKEAVTAVHAFLRRRNLLPTGGLNVATSTERLKRDPWRILVDMARLLPQTIDSLFREHADQDLPESLRRSPHPILSTALWSIMSEELCSKDVLEGSLHLDPRGAARMRARFRERHRREQLIAVRHARVLNHFERELYSDPGQDLNALWWDLLKTNLHINARDEGRHPAWAISRELLAPCGTAPHRGLGIIAGAQIQDSLPPVARDASVLVDSEAAAMIRDLYLRPAAGRSWPEHLKQTTGRPLEARSFAERFSVSP
ncbi:MAG: hypothetical protein CMJ83_12865 [Planctomycetes bacterium]|nr:hypothetical protein [Planctomycetota bacterium]